MSGFDEQFQDDFELEARVIGAIVGGGGVGFRDFDLRAEDFSRSSFQAVFEKLEYLFERQGMFDVWGVERLLKGNELARRDLWVAYEMSGMFPHLVTGWLGFLYERASQRLMVQVSEMLQSGLDVGEKMLQAKVLFDRVVRSEFVLPDLRYDMQMTLNEILNPKPVIESCFGKLNDIVVGFRPGRFYVVGARPGVGKTLVGLQLAWDLSKRFGVGFVSFEMAKEELLRRVFAQELEIPLDRLERQDLSASEKQQIQGLIVEADERLLLVDDPKLSVAGLRRFVLNAKKRAGGLDVLFVDYLQLVPTDEKFVSKREKVEAVSLALKQVAREFGLAVVALAQLNRGAKEDESPAVSDFKESGQVEQDADVVVLLHRKASQYDKEKNFELEAQGLKPVKNLMVLDVAKNRHGAVGSFVLSVQGAYSRLGAH